MSLLDDLPYGYYQCIHADVPWSFESWSERGEERSAQRHYDCMLPSEIMQLPVVAHAAPSSHLFFWVTGPFLVTGAHIPIMRAWGFEPTAIAFVWLKLNKSWHPRWMGFMDDAMWHFGLGHTTRQNAEYCLLGRRGAPVRSSKSVRQVIAAPIREHSRKPEDVYERIERYCDGPRLELFGRQTRAGWTVRGDEVTKFDRRESSTAGGPR